MTKHRKFPTPDDLLKANTGIHTSQTSNHSSATWFSGGSFEVGAGGRRFKPRGPRVTIKRG